LCASVRAMMSGAPPGANGTRMRGVVRGEIGLHLRQCRDRADQEKSRNCDRICLTHREDLHALRCLT
jgi:hypothetical protein